MLRSQQTVFGRRLGPGTPESGRGRPEDRTWTRKTSGQGPRVHPTLMELASAP